MPESIFDMPAARMAGQGWLLQPETDAEKLVLPPPSETLTEMLEPESCLAGQTAMECAQQGKRTAVEDEERLNAYEAVISLLWQREN